MSRNNTDHVLWTLIEHGGSKVKSDLDRRLQMRHSELDVVLKELEAHRESSWLRSVEIIWGLKFDNRN